MRGNLRRGTSSIAVDPSPNFLDSLLGPKLEFESDCNRTPAQGGDRRVREKISACEEKGERGERRERKSRKTGSNLQTKLPRLRLDTSGPFVLGRRCLYTLRSKMHLLRKPPAYAGAKRPSDKTELFMIAFIGIIF
jgi:hypothetical protein